MAKRTVTILVLTSGALAGGGAPACERAEQAADSQPPATSASAEPSSPLLATPHDGKRVYAVGETAEARDYELVLKNVKECKVEEYFKAKKGHLKLGVEVSIRGRTDREVPVNPFYAKLTDSDGYSHSSTFGGCTPELQAVRIKKGDKALGWITFELPKSARGLKFDFAPFILGTGRQTVRFDLGR